MPARRQPAIRSYPWDTLPRLDREGADNDRAVRNALHSVFDLSRLGRIVRELFAAEVEAFGLSECPENEYAPIPAGAEVQFEHSALSLWLSVEPGLATLLLTRLLGKAAVFARPEALSPALSGAWHATCEELARRLARADAPVVSRNGEWGSGSVRTFWIRIEGQTYRGMANAQPRGSSSILGADPASVELPVSLPLVLASTRVQREKLSLLALGDVFVPHSWGVTGEPLSGRVFACASLLTRAFLFELSGSELKLVGPAQLDLDEEACVSSNDNDTSEDAVVDVPVVVRVEVGAVTMSAREWLKLSPGDVISTGNALASPVVLRVAGQQVALGELVDLEGELGVRVTKLS